MKNRSISGGLFLKALVSFILLAFVLLKINWGQAMNLVRQSDLAWWIAAILLTAAAILVSSFKWQLVLRSQRTHAPITRLASSYFIGLFLNNFLPTSMGGDVYRAYDVAGLAGGIHKSLASVVAERVLAMATLATTAVLGLIFGFHLTGRFAWLVILFSAGCAILVWACLDIRWIGFLTRRISFFNKEKIRQRFEETKKALKAPVHDKPILMNVLILSLIFQVIVVIVNLTVFKALKIDVSPIYLFIFVPIISAVSMLPVSINGLGVQQGASVLLFGVIGLTPTQATAQSIGFLLVVALVSLPGFLFLVMRKSQKEVVV